MTRTLADMPDVLTVTQLAAVLGRSRRTIDRLISRPIPLRGCIVVHTPTTGVTEGRPLLFLPSGGLLLCALRAVLLQQFSREFSLRGAGKERSASLSYSALLDIW